MKALICRAYCRRRTTSALEVVPGNAAAFVAAISVSPSIFYHAVPYPDIVVEMFVVSSIYLGY